MNEDTKIQVLSDHYKDTYSYLFYHLKRRNRLFFYILAIVTIMLFQVYSPTNAEKALIDFLTEKIGLKGSVDIVFVGTILWVTLLVLILLYFQTTLYMERQYGYLTKIEEEINKHFKGDVITREGKSYLNDYPAFSNWLWFIFTIVFPVLMILFVCFKAYFELNSAFSCSASLIINMLLAMLIAISVVIYLASFHRCKK